MDNSTFIIGSLLVGFFIFVTVRGSLPAYQSILLASA